MSGRFLPDVRWLLLCFPLLSGCGFHWVTGEGRVGEVHLCDSHQCDTETLSPEDPVMLRIAVDEAPYGTRVASAWYYLEWPLSRTLLRERMSDVDHPQWVLHRLEPPRPGYWKPGLYLVEITVQDRLAARRTFRMPPRPQEAPPAPMTPRPAKKDILDEDF